ncbi:MAG: NADH-quinone oxidoreductase subunit L [Sedimentisphaerales bacterium]
MSHAIWLIPFLPLAGFLALAIAGRRLNHSFVSIIAVGPTIASCAIAWTLAALFVLYRPESQTYAQTIGTWFNIYGFHITFGFYYDALAVVMTVVITFVASLILLYSVKYMEEDESYGRFFTYMNLFVASMLILVLADNFLWLYLGWEGVGLCSYLLIGFWYKEPENCHAAMKAFIVTRIGDTLLVIGLFMLIFKYGSLTIQPVMNQISQLPKGTAFCTLTALFLLSGAVGKSAQLPLQTWLPDAMAGPTPVSALIHAATMVTAGVYLIARANVLFSMVPAVMHVVAYIGAATLLLAGFSGFVQKDIKRVLAYSTISQIGYMFLALGAGAWAAAIYHFLTHAFFKSALFLGAGVMLHVLDDEHDIFKMGGMRKQFPNTFRAFLMASLTLAALPPLTISFNSKDLILNAVRTSTAAGYGFWVAGVVGAYLTAAYSFRLLYVVFYGEMKMKPNRKPTAIMVVPLTILALFAAISGIPDLITTLFHRTSLYEFLKTALPENYVTLSLPIPGWEMQIFYAAVSLVAFGVTYLFYRNEFKLAKSVASTFIGSAARLYLFAGFGFDRLYYSVLVRPYIWINRINRNDIMDWITKFNVIVFVSWNRLLSRMQNGNLRWYLGGICIGALVLLGIVIFS